MNTPPVIQPNSKPIPPKPVMPTATTGSLPPSQLRPHQARSGGSCLSTLLFLFLLGGVLVALLSGAFYLEASMQLFSVELPELVSSIELFENAEQIEELVAETDVELPAEPAIAENLGLENPPARYGCH